MSFYLVPMVKAGSSGHVVICCVGERNPDTVRLRPCVSEHRADVLWGTGGQLTNRIKHLLRGALMGESNNVI